MASHKTVRVRMLQPPKANKQILNNFIELSNTESKRSSQAAALALTLYSASLTSSNAIWPPWLDHSLDLTPHRLHFFWTPDTLFTCFSFFTRITDYLPGTGIGVGIRLHTSVFLHHTPPTRAEDQIFIDFVLPCLLLLEQYSAHHSIPQNNFNP